MSPGAAAPESQKPPAAHLLLVSDLHMTAAQGQDADVFADDAAFAATLDWFASELTEPTRLVLLGDLCDFVLTAPHVRPGAAGDDVAAAKLEAIAAAHPRVFAALAAFAAAGHSLEIVPGNHDIELLRDSIQTRLQRLLGGAPLTFHPWILHVPGVLYAEHGQQHHFLNHFVGLLRRSEAATGAGLPPPPGRSLDDLRALLANCVEPPPHNLAALYGLGYGLWRLARSCATLVNEGRNEPPTMSLPAASRDIGLPAEALAELTRRSIPTVRSTVRSARRASHARSTAVPRDRYMLEAARMVDRVLREHGASVPFYAFGHTHVARDASLAHTGPPSMPGETHRPRYLNCGTWSTLLRPGRDGATDRLKLIEIAHSPREPPHARWWRWDPDAGRPALLPELEAGLV